NYGGVYVGLPSEAACMVSSQAKTVRKRLFVHVHSEIPASEMVLPTLRVSVFSSAKPVWKSSPESFPGLTLPGPAHLFCLWTLGPSVAFTLLTVVRASTVDLCVATVLMKLLCGQSFLILPETLAVDCVREESGLSQDEQEAEKAYTEKTIRIKVPTLHCGCIWELQRCVDLGILLIVMMHQGFNF
ncbi:hypothetical protein STEG23_030479, partial [Scotinomys teguina]